MKVVTRYLLRSHLAPFAFAFVALTGVILINTVARELAGLAGKGLPLSVVMEFFVLSLPANIALTLPMAVLVAVLHAFSTLAADNEITALRASGVDLRRATLPLIVAAAVITGAMIWFNDQVLPQANYRWRNLMFSVAQTRPLLDFREQTFNPIPGPTGSTQFYLEARQINRETGEMRGVTIYDISNDQMTRTINADSGRVSQGHTQSDLLVTLYDGQVREVGFNIPSDYHVFAFSKEVMKLKDVFRQLERTLGSDYRTDRDMTLTMMRARIDTLRVERATILRAVGDTLVEGGETPVAAEAAPEAVGDSALPLPPGMEAATREADSSVAIAGGLASPPGSDTVSSPDSSAAGTPAVDPALALAEGSGTPPLTDLPPPGEELSDEIMSGLSRLDQIALGTVDGNDAQEYAQARALTIDNEIRRFWLEIHKKFAIASATLVFVLIGIPTALRFPRGGVGMVMAVSLTIFGIYYVGLIGGEKLSDKGFVSPAAAMWTTNIVFGTIGLIAFLRLGREQGNSRGGGSPMLYRIFDWFSRNKAGNS